MPVDERDGMVGRAPASAEERRLPLSATKRSYCAFVTGVRAELEGVHVDDVAAVSRPGRGRSRSRRPGTSTQSKPWRGSTATTRKPMYGSRAAGCTGSRAEQRSSSGPLRYEPPRSGAVGRPLPDVAGQVERAARRGSRRMQPGRRRPADALPEGRARRVGKLVAPGPEPVVAAAGGRLPLDLGRQPHAVRGAERLRVGARDVRQRHAVVARHRRAADPEALDRDDPPRRLVLVRRIVARRGRSPSGTAPPGSAPSRSRDDGQRHRAAVHRLLGDDLVRVPADRLAGVRVPLEPREVRGGDVDAGSGGRGRRGWSSAAARS